MLYSTRDVIPSRRRQPLASMECLDKALLNHHYYQAKNMLSTGCLAGTRDVQGRTSLLRVVDVPDEGVAIMLARILLRQGEDINATDHQGQSVLVHAVRKGHVRLTRKILDHINTRVSISNRGNMKLQKGN